MYSSAAHLRLWTLAILGLLADLGSKYWAFTSMESPQVLINGVLSFQRSYNTGALWGMGRGMSPLFIIASLVALVIVLGVFAKSDRSQRSFHVGLGMIVAGALGNLYDRLFIKLPLSNGSEIGAVRDFIKIELSIGKFELWPWIFNIADLLLVVGVSILMIHIWLSGTGSKKAQGEQENLAT